MQRVVKAHEAYCWSRNVAVSVGRNWREMHLIGRHQSAGRDGRSRARRWFRAVFDPGGKILQEGTYRPRMRIWIRLLLAEAERLPCAKRQWRRPMLGRGHNVAAHVGQFDQVADTERIGKAERLAQLPHFEGGGRMHDL